MMKSLVGVRLQNCSVKRVNLRFNFRFENTEYCVSIADVMMFPQGYSAVLTQTGLLDEPSVIIADIGV